MTLPRSMHWTHRARARYGVRQGGNAMLDNSVLAGETIRHGAYVCVRLAGGADAIPALATSVSLENEFGRPAAPESIAFLRRVGATPADIADEGVLHADAV